MENKIQAGVAQYFKPKDENDPDLVGQIRELLINSGLRKLVEENFDTHRFIIDAAGKHSNAQRFLLNNFWHLQLMSAAKQSTEERYCLIPNGDVKNWLNLFKVKVLPFIIENNLPTKIS